MLNKTIKFEKCQIAYTTGSGFIDEDGTELFPRTLVKEWMNKTAYHGFHMTCRKAFYEDLVGKERPTSKLLYCIHVPNWVKIQYAPTFLAKTPEDALEGAMEWLDRYIDKCLTEAQHMKDEYSKLCNQVNGNPCTMTERFMKVD